LPVSSSYCELSIKWVMRVLFTIFPCIKACSNQNDLPSYLRWLLSMVCSVFFLNCLQCVLLVLFAEIFKLTIKKSFANYSVTMVTK
jgi:hypothetical protein